MIYLYNFVYIYIYTYTDIVPETSKANLRCFEALSFATNLSKSWGIFVQLQRKPQKPWLVMAFKKLGPWSCRRDHQDVTTVETDFLSMIVSYVSSGLIYVPHLFFSFPQPYPAHHGSSFPSAMGHLATLTFLTSLKCSGAPCTLLNGGIFRR